ncbi:hypothetical protein FB570_111233 [Streptomyces sp. T12]|nr:hypothetical protein FB570_111233 [Streptomyces sp. T12]
MATDRHLAQIATGFGVSGGTAHAYVAAVIDMLADRVPGLLRVVCEADFDYVLPDGTLAECANRALSAARAPVERGGARLNHGGSSARRGTARIE